MTNRTKFFINGFILTVVGLAIRTVGLFFSSFVSREVGAYGLGLYTLIMTVYSFALTFATSGISLTVTRLVASLIGEGKKNEVTGLLKGAFLYSFLFGAAANIVLLALAGVLGKGVVNDVRAVLPLQILSFSLIPSAMSGVISGYFVGVRRVSFNAFVQIITQVFKVVFTVYLVLSMSKLGVEYAVCALCIGVSVAELLGFVIALIEFSVDRIKRRNDGKESGIHVKPIAEMALPLAISQYIRSGLLSIEHSIIPKRLIYRGNTTEQALSSYGYLHGMALPMVLYPMSPLTSFSGLLVPEFAMDLSGGNTKRLERHAKEAVSLTCVYAIMMSVFMYLFSEELGYTVYGSYEAGHFIAILAPVLPIMYLDHVVDSMLKGIGEHVFSMWVNIADALLSIALVWVLIPVFDIYGYAFVIIGMEGFNFLLSLWKLRRRVKFKLDFVKSVLLPFLASVGAAYLSKMLFSTSGEATPVQILVYKIIFALSAFVALYMLASLAYSAFDFSKRAKVLN